MLTYFQVSIAVVVVSLVAIFIGSPNDPSRVTRTEADHLQGHAFNTTVVILNWSRFDNVKLITSSICEHLLENTVKSIVVWNNNPIPLSYEIFVNSSCPKTALKIVNSPENLYFEARYMACAQAETEFCFIQDDDYFVRPDTIKMLAFRIHEKSLNSIHLQPPDEMLSSQLRTINIGASVHTTFAWLGYGTIIKRFLAVEFLALLDKLQLSDEEHKMADNYFTILSNTVPERWFDPGIPLGGGQPFTVGTEGEQKNNRHIIRAAGLLDSITQKDVQSLNLPYVRFLPHSRTEEDSSRAPCQHGLCLLETSIRLLPENFDRSVSGVSKMLELEKRGLEHLGEMRKSHYLEFPPSNMVDSRYDTAFRSFDNAKAGDWIMLDLFQPSSSVQSALVLVVGRETEDFLRNAISEVSRDGRIWDGFANVFDCFDVLNPELNSAMPLKTCKIVYKGGDRRFYRVRLLDDMQQKWVVHEMFLE